MYQWLKVLQMNRLQGEKAEDDFKISDWRSLAIRFIVEVEVDANPISLIRVDSIPFFFELLNASLAVPLGSLIQIYVGEGWEIIGSPAKENGYDIQIGFELSEGRKPVFIRQMSKHETMLFIAAKLSEIAGALQGLGVNIENYFSQFPPSEYQRGISS